MFTYRQEVTNKAGRGELAVTPMAYFAVDQSRWSRFGRDSDFRGNEVLLRDVAFFCGTGAIPLY